jgi:6-phosphogluconolactonase
VTYSRTIRIGAAAALASHLVEHLCHAVEAAVAARGRCTIAIPGGSVATAILPLFSQRELPWHAVHLFWCDERAVLLTENDSNGGSALRLVAHSPLAKRAIVHLMRGDAVDLRRAAHDYAVELRSIAGSPPVLDVVLLGVGEDGHVASLFPGHDTGPATAGPPVLLVNDAPKVPPTRLTLALPVLTTARETIVMAVGSAKATAVHAALEATNASSPLARIIRESRTLLLLLDPLAAEQLAHTTVEQIV